VKTADSLSPLFFFVIPSPKGTAKDENFFIAIILQSRGNFTATIKQPQSHTIKKDKTPIRQTVKA